VKDIRYRKYVFLISVYVMKTRITTLIHYLYFSPKIYAK